MLVQVEMLADRLKFSFGRCLTKQPVGTVNDDDDNDDNDDDDDDDDDDS